MGMQDLSNATHPVRRRADGADHPSGEKFRSGYTEEGARHSFMWRSLETSRAAPVNPKRQDIDDPATMTTVIKEMATALGADAVGIAKYHPELAFGVAEKIDHRVAIVMAKTMSYDVMIDIGPNSQEEVHRVYFALNEMASRLALHIGSFGYEARMQTNGGEIPLPAYGQLSGIGELGKHGSLISPELGSSFRLVAVTTDMPLVVDGPADHGIDEICASCQVCERFCPGEAIKPDKKTVNGVNRWYVDTPACEPFFYELYGCKICLMVCPYNARGKLGAGFKPVAADIRAAKDAEGLMRVIRKRSKLPLDRAAGMGLEGGADDT